MSIGFKTRQAGDKHDAVVLNLGRFFLVRVGGVARRRTRGDLMNHTLHSTSVKDTRDPSDSFL